MANNFRVRDLYAENLNLTNRPFVNGTGVLLSGEIVSQSEATGVSGFLQSQIDTLNNQTGNYTLNSNTGSFLTTGSTSFGVATSTNSFGVSAYNNSFGETATFNSFGSTSSSNNFGSQATVNQFGDDASTNTFGISSAYNYVGSDSAYNYIGNNAGHGSEDSVDTSNEFGCIPYPKDGGSVNNIFGYGANTNRYGQYSFNYYYSGNAYGQFTFDTNLKVGTAETVLTTGTQNISGAKNFYTRPTINGTGVLLSGEASGGITESYVTGISGSLQTQITSLNNQTGNYAIQDNANLIIGISVFI